MAEVLQWEQLKTTALEGGGKRRIFTGNSVMLARHDFPPGFPSSPHRHPQEQILMVFEGECEFQIEEETFQMKAGDMIHIPPNAFHGLTVTGDRPAVICDIFAPVRGDFLMGFLKE